MYHAGNAGLAITALGAYLGAYDVNTDEFVPSRQGFLEHVMRFSILKAHFLGRLKILGIKKVF